MCGICGKLAFNSGQKVRHRTGGSDDEQSFHIAGRTGRGNTYPARWGLVMPVLPSLI